MNQAVLNNASVAFTVAAAATLMLLKKRKGKQSGDNDGYIADDLGGWSSGGHHGCDSGDTGDCGGDGGGD